MIGLFGQYNHGMWVRGESGEFRVQSAVLVEILTDFFDLRKQDLTVTQKNKNKSRRDLNLNSTLHSLPEPPPRG